MGKAALIAWREIRWEIFGDRGAVIRTGFFALLPILFVISGRGSPGGPGNLSLLVLALQSTLIPALSGVALIASTFTQEKENGTLVPLLASPVRDLDIVVGKLLGMVGPVMLICTGSLAVFYVLGTFLYGATRMQVALPPEVLYALLVLAFLYLITAGSWVLIIAAVVRTTRAGQQIAGLMIGVSAAIFAVLGIGATRIADGWALVALGVFFVVADVIALLIARRVWQRGEVIGRL
ncbi:MAG TPA: ABC transporter permease [Candidatus Limnocylindria bacterium]|nr:ABC transporter permease [Candidatus Limnocylindria bacterium]